MLISKGLVMTEKPQYFDFEADFVKSMRCIPMQVRYKLDACGIKLNLKVWSRLSPEQRCTLSERPATTSNDLEKYREYLSQLIINLTGEAAREIPVIEHPAWREGAVIPEEVAKKADESGITLRLEDWENLSELQRFALIKLVRPSHENHNFLPALKEFGLA
jgi:hypothetical protein